MDFVAASTFVFEYQFLNNSVLVWAIALAALSFIFLGLWILRRILVSRLGAMALKTDTDVDDFIVDLIQNTRLFFIAAFAIGAASFLLRIPLEARHALRSVFVVALAVQAGFWGNTAIQFFVGRLLKGKQDKAVYDGAVATTVSIIEFLSRLVLVSFIALVILNNLGIDVTALIAGLGVGGIAVALAAQNILGDLFASLSIAIDKPFVIGDAIEVGSDVGTVEKVGIKTTRLRGLGGEQLVFSNTELTKNRIRNFKRMNERRVLFSLGVEYDTEVEKLKRIPEMLQSIIESQKPVRFERAHLKRFGASSLDFEVVYFVLDSDYAAYVRIEHAVNLEICRRFSSEGIAFAFPTQTLFVHSAALEGARS